MPRKLRETAGRATVRGAGAGGSRAAARRTGAKTVTGSAARASGAFMAAGGPVVTIRGNNGRRIIEATVGTGAPLGRMAEEWAYILRSRQRWSDKPEVRRSLRTRALEDLKQVGIERRFLAQLVSSPFVEVELPAWDPNDRSACQAHEMASDVPWEYLISAATRGLGRFRPTLTTRLLRNRSPAVITTPPRNVLFVESAPGRLEDEYEFKTERARIKAAVGADGDPTDSAGRTITFSETEKATNLRRRVRTGRYEVIHVTGVDTHQATLFIPKLYDDLEKKYKEKKSEEKKNEEYPIIDDSGQVRDGMILRESNRAELPVSYEKLADILVDPEKPPYLVTLNLYHSGSRTAREMVRRGAHAALGILDEIDDELAELFLQAFYWAWCRPGGGFDIPAAFLEAWRQLKDLGDRLHGTAIVMWLGESVFAQKRLEAVARAPATAEELTDADRAGRIASHGRTPIDRLLQVECAADDEINYSLLHNQRALLRKLTLTKLIKEPLEDITVNVELNLGAQNYPYRSTCLVLKEPQLAMAPSVRIPLTATLPRALRERVQSTVYVKVELGGRTAYEDTKRVTLIPVDEWLDDTKNNPWLPSFVLPRDPAILRIVASARRYLIGIRDDPAAGFDGYQSFEEKADEPAEGVDAQVRAVWTALVNEYRLQYINPPPSYSEQTQRLRTPSDILESNSGTCIDLALLLASCLEYVDIYPVVVLLSGHAFAGYWRWDTWHDDFVEVRRVPAMVPAVGGKVAREAGVPFVDKYGWRFTRLHYEEIMEHVAAGKLVLLEATYLTSASSFAEAMEEGRANMRSKRQFDSLLDIQLARSARPPVTPLPIIGS